MNRKGIFIILALVAVGLVVFAVHGCQRRADRMRAVLDSALEQNRNYIPFTSDSALLEVVEYYDRYGTPNDRLRAHYALGCVYRDLHDAPIALLTWERGIAAADTTAADCDFATLFRVYGQMASIYFRQYLPEKQLEAENAFSHYALCAGDTLNYIRGLLLRDDAFLSLGDTAAIYRNAENVRKLYLNRGLKQEAAQVYPMVIRLAIDQQQFALADSLMQIFEEKSGLFDEEGNIVRGYERYYYNKGMYYLGVEQTDSAELQFRKLLQCESARIDAYRGLLSLYNQKYNSDSTFKYARLYEDALARYMKSTHIQSIDLSKGMYDYSNQQHIAQEQKEKAHRFQISFLLFVMLASIGILISFMWYRKKKRESEIRQKALLEKYDRAQQELEAIQKEVAILQQSPSEIGKLQSLLEEKNDKIDTLTSLIKDLQKQINDFALDTNEDLIDIVQHFHEMAHPQRITNKENGEQNVVPARAAKKSEWNQLSKAMKLNHPRFYLYTSIEHHLTSRELQVCMLSYLNFEIVEMATLLNISKQSVTNTRASVAKKLFGQEKASILNENLKNL